MHSNTFVAADGRGQSRTIRVIILLNVSVAYREIMVQPRFELLEKTCIKDRKGSKNALQSISAKVNVVIISRID